MEAQNASSLLRVLRPTLVIFFAWFIISTISNPQQTPDVQHTVANLPDSGRYYALVIGIDDYHGIMPRLKTAVADAQAISDLLHYSFGFEVETLLNADASRINILKAVSRYRSTLGENDSLLIYYAGHGIFDKDADKAYWLPVDAESPDSPNRIIADDVTSGVRVLSARHVLVISDSCYSGGMSRGGPTTEKPDGSAAFLNRMMRGKSRTLMSSGGNEPVDDSGSEGHSVFAYALLRALSEADRPRFTATEVFYAFVQERVAGNSAQVPDYAPLRNSGHSEGDFVFVRAAAPVRPVVLDSGISPVRFGAQPETVSRMYLSPPNPDWYSMRIAREYAPTEVRFFFAPTWQFPAPDAPGSPFQVFSAFRSCWGTQSRLTFLFAHHQLIRTSLRLFPECATQETLLDAWAKAYKVPAVEKQGHLKYRRVLPDIIIEGYVTNGHVATVELFDPNSPSPYDSWWDGDIR